MRVKPNLEARENYKGLWREVKQWLNQYDEDEKESVIEDLFKGGCQSGMVGNLIYYVDTIRFFNRNKAEISKLLSELIEDTGLGVDKLFGKKWDKEDPLAMGTMNQNLLAWFGFEEMARRMFDN